MKHEFNKNKNCSVYIYNFADGDNCILVAGENVAQRWVDVLRELDREAYNNEQTETRRHISIEAMVKGHPTSSEDYDAVEFALFWSQVENELTKRQKQIGQLYFLDGYQEGDIAAMLSVYQSTVLRHILAIRKKLKKYFI
jgi:RNA polymerase sigma factor (sigma-70 family)